MQPHAECAAPKKRCISDSVCVFSAFTHSSGEISSETRMRVYIRVPHTGAKPESINTSKRFETSPLNRSRRCRPTYQHAVSKLGKGVRVLTFSRFSISYALRKIKKTISAKHHHGLLTKDGIHKVLPKRENS